MTDTLLVAQALVERGLLESMAAGLLHAEQQLDLWVGTGNGRYVALAAAGLIFLFLVRVRR